jgi:two-component system sensor histidine kinase KdpD
VSLPRGLLDAWLRQRSPTRRVVAWALAIAGPLVLTLAALPLRSSSVLGGFLFCMMLVVIAAAAVGGARPALTAVVLGVLAGEFFAPPFESLHVDLRPDVISLVVFAGVGAVVAILIGELAQLAEEQASSRRVEAALRRIATLVAGGVPSGTCTTVPSRISCHSLLRFKDPAA